ncbi:MAG TPA: ribose-phosphate pyrophosphokinase [Bacillota bacterium]
MVLGGSRLKIFSGNATPDLAREIAEHLGTTLGEIEVDRFSNGEVRVIVNESVRGADVFVVQSTCEPVNDALMELLIMIDAFRRASARRITAVIPFYGYARQDRKTRGREPITAKLVANLIATAGADRVLSMDLHAGQIQGFFDIPVDHLTAVPLLSQYLVQKDLGDIVVVSPDPGGVTRARNMADRLGFSFAIIDKRRPAPNVAEVMNVIGAVDNKHAVLIDDMIDTAGTVAEGARVLRELGARSVYVAATHPVLSGPSLERLEAAPIQEVIVTNTIPIDRNRIPAKFTVLSVARLFAQAILRIHEDLSVSTLFT